MYSWWSNTTENIHNTEKHPKDRCVCLEAKKRNVMISKCFNNATYKRSIDVVLFTEGFDKCCVVESSRNVMRAHCLNQS